MVEIRRGSLRMDTHFTTVPNEWARDACLSRRARGLLVELLSHSAGWVSTFAGLQRHGPEGREALQTAINELTAAGYLEVVQDRDEGGRMTGKHYELRDPAVERENRSTGKPSDGKSETKKNNNQEEQGSKNPPNPPGGGSVAVIDSWFEKFYGAYPKKKAPEAARRAFAKAVAREAKRTGWSVERAGEAIALAAVGYAADPNLPGRADPSEARFIPYPASWLNAGSYADGPLPTRKARAQAGPASADEMLAMRERFDN